MVLARAVMRSSALSSICVADLQLFTLLGRAQGMNGSWAGNGEGLNGP